MSAVESVRAGAAAPSYRLMWRRRRRRYAATCAALLALVLVIAILALGTGSFQISPADVIRTLLQQEDGPARFVVLDLRLPRTLDGVLVGLAMGMAGAIFQSLTRNPLGSPDVIGFGAGASAGGLIAIIVFGASAVVVGLGAVGGGLLTAAAVYLLAWRRGVQGNRLILVGIGVSAALGSATQYLYVRADVGVAAQAASWTIGSLNARGYSDVLLVVIALVLCGPAALLLARRMELLELGDDPAAALGVGPQLNRLLMLAIGTCLTAGAVAAAGPIPFVALAAPQLARRITRAPGPGIAAAGCMGALLVSAADWGTARIFGTSVMPVGIITGVCGGAYLGWLLFRERRSMVAM